MKSSNLLKNSDSDLFDDSITDEYFSDLTPLSLNEFGLIKNIGKGAYSTIYLVKEKNSGQTYAAKILNLASDVGYIQRCYKEIEILDQISKLNCPFLIKYIGYSLKGFHGGSQPTIIMQYASNDTLYRLIDLEAKGIAPIEWNYTNKLMIIYGIAHGMSVLHSNGIIHRDLKTGNILLDDYLMPIIADFGLSIKEDELLKEKEYESIGTFAYMAPEVIKREPYTKSIDVYSFSIVVYEIMTGKMPFNRLNPFQIQCKVTSGERLKIDDCVPESYRNLIERCWSQKPDDRPTFEEIVTLLKTDKGFIGDLVDEEEFLSFIDSLENQSKEELVGGGIDDGSKTEDDSKNENGSKTEDDSKIKDDSKTEDDSKAGDASKIKPKFRFNKVHVEYPETNELLVDVDPIDLDLFERMEFVGRGVFGKVYKVKEKKTDEYFASKTNIKLLQFCKENEVTNLTREINILSKIKSPAILRFIGYNLKNFKGKQKPTIITEFSKNGSLEDIIELQNRGLKPDKWTNTKVLITIYGVAFGMSYLHSKDILHRDLKPANIFYDEYLFPKIGDFGLSKEINSEKAKNMLPYQVGTPAFMSPEILNENRYCKASDVYAFGILLYQMMTLQLPYEGLNFFQVGQLVNQGKRPQFDVDIPDCYRRLIEQCWAGKEEDRPTFKQIVDLLENDDDFINVGLDMINEVDEGEFLNYIDYVKNNKISDSLKPITVDFEELKRIQENDPTLNVSFLELNQFEKIKIIKRLDNFKIYEVVNKETNQHCEAKISTIRITRLSQKETIHLQREINILSKLSHPSFLKFIGYSPIDFNQQPNPIIVTEMPPNRSLYDLLNVERSGEDHVDEWTDTKKLINIYGIASGMAYLHSNNVIHRNLNPESIFLDDYLFPKIGNFGLLTKIHTIKSMTFQTTIGIKGNPSYSSPELLMLNEYSKKSDVYAFALIVYELMTLNVPFASIANFNGLFNEVVTKSNRPVLDDESIPDCYRQLIELCWSQNPEERPSFEEITSLLKNDKDFITKDVNKEEFNEYVELIEKSKIDFYSANRVVNFDDIIQSKKREHKEEEEKQERKSKTKTKIKTKIAPKIKQINKDDDDDDHHHIKPKSKKDKDKTKSKSKNEASFEINKSVSKSSRALKRIDSKNFVNEFNSVYDDLYNKKFIGSIKKEVNDYLLQNSVVISDSPISTDYKVIVGKSTSDKDFILIKSIEREGFKKENINKINSEYKIINELNHPNIVKSLGSYTSKIDESTSSILFEFYSRKIKNVIESIEDVYLISLIYEIAHAMNTVHSRKIIHRNLNIDNIFVDFENHAKIAEFENSILMSVTEQINNSKERPFFISRELLNNEEYNEKVDVFSFGVIMEFILRRGKGPFIKRQDIIDGNKAKVPKSINKVSFSIILKCLSHSPEDRPNFKAIVHTIKKFKFKLIDGIEDKVPIIEKQLRAIIDKKPTK